MKNSTKNATGTERKDSFAHADRATIKAWAKLFGIPGAMLTVIFLILGQPGLGFAVAIITVIIVGGYTLFVLAVAETAQNAFEKMKRDER